MNLKNKIVCITGASAGIGEACAEIFAEAGTRLILIARRRDKLIEISQRLLNNYGTESYNIELDITKHSKVRSAFKSLPKEWQEIDIIINNAGLARGMDKIWDVEISDMEEMFDTNIKGLLYISNEIIPQMVERHSGLIINVSSLAGREIYPNGVIYCSTKHALNAISKGMTIDLNGTGVRVCNLAPGLTETEFSLVRFRGDKEKAASVYKGYQPLLSRDVAEVALFVATRPEHVMIQDILITPTAQASVLIVDKKL
jgi:3-hydroxy acid dehydrogenase / malonic semialdehyde reductase